MSNLENHKKYIKRGAYSEIYTPENAVELILPYIPKRVKTVWECTDYGKSNITKVLNENGYNVISTHKNKEQDFFIYEPENYDIIITNPPYELKNEFLLRCYELKKPFMLLVPIAITVSKARHFIFQTNDYQCLIPDFRINFKPELKSSFWVDTVWITDKCNYPKQMNYISLGKQKTLF